MIDEIEVAKDLIKIPSFSPIGSSQKETIEKFAACQDAIDCVASYAKSFGAKTLTFVFEGGDDKWHYPVPNLYSEIIIGNPNAKDHKYLCYMGHVDVVPLGNEKEWAKKPFAATQEDGYIYGRGATDMKGSVASWLSALEKLQSSFNPDINITLGSIITADEEWAAVNGTKKVLEWLKANNKNPDAFIVGEPSSQDLLGTNIKIGRRGSLCGTIEANGIQGHRAYDQLFKNPNRALNYALCILNQKIWKDGNKYFPDTTFENYAIKSGDFCATAIIQNSAKAGWNVRFTNKQTKEKIYKDLQNIILNPPQYLKKHPDYKEARNVIITANLITASEPYYSEPATLAFCAKDAIKNMLGIEAKIDGFGGTTDGRFVQNYFPHAQIIEVGLPEKGGITPKTNKKTYGKIGGMHQVDERASVDDIKKLSNLYANIINKYGER